MAINVKISGFEDDQAGVFNEIGAPVENVPSAFNDTPVDFGQGQVLFVNGSNGTYSAGSLAQVAQSLPLAKCAYIAPADFLTYVHHLRPSHISTFVPPLESLPPGFTKVLAEFIGNPEGPTPLSGYTNAIQLKANTFANSEEWNAFAGNLMGFLSKYGMDGVQAHNLFQQIEMAVINNTYGFEYLMDGEVFIGGVTLPIAITEEKAYEEIMAIFDGADTPPADGTPGNLVFNIMKGAHFLFVRKTSTGVHLAFSYFLKNQPPFKGYSLRYSKPELQQANAFETVDPGALAQQGAMPDPAAAAPVPDMNRPISEGEIPPALMGGPTPIPAAAAMDPNATGLPDAGAPPPMDMGNMEAQLKQYEVLNNIYMHANKILGEEIKRLVRQRKEPSTDEELKYARTQLEIKIKKLLVRLTQYDSTLRETNQRMENIKEQLDAAVEEKKQAEERIGELEEELIQSRTG